MLLEKEECENVAIVLEKTIKALRSKDMISLKELSNHTIHSSCRYQDSESIALAIIIYALSKLIERGDFTRIQKWDKFVKKFSGILKLAILAIKEENWERYSEYIRQARSTLESISVNLRPYINDVLKKASINKGSKIYEHGISLEKTSKILGVSQWELSSYVGQKNIADVEQNRTIDIKKRAKMALEFFS